MDNKPAGADQDKSAPFNQPNYINCPTCYGSGTLGTGADEHGIYEEECGTCDGTGLIEE